MSIAERWLAAIEQLGVLAFCTYADAVAVARACKAARAAVAAHPWALDRDITQINQRLAECAARVNYEYIERWHRACPRAVRCTVRLSAMLQGDAAFFANLKHLRLIVDAGRPGRTTYNLDEALAHARQLESLIIEHTPANAPRPHIFASPSHLFASPPHLFASPPHLFASTPQLIASNMAFAAQKKLRRLSIQGPIHGAHKRRLQFIFAPLEALEELELVDTNLDCSSIPHKLHSLIICPI
jgi:hypothetical protein